MILLQQKFTGPGHKIWKFSMSICMYLKVVKPILSMSVWLTLENTKDGTTKPSHFSVYWVVSVLRHMSVSPNVSLRQVMSVKSWLVEMNLGSKMAMLNSMQRSLNSSFIMIWIERLRQMLMSLMILGIAMLDNVAKSWKMSIDVIINAVIELLKTGHSSILINLQLSVNAKCRFCSICHQVT